MTSSQSYARLLLYIFISFMGVIVPNWAGMVDASTHEWNGLFMQAALQAAIALRAYIDKSPSEVRPNAEILPNGLPKADP